MPMETAHRVSDIVAHVFVFDPAQWGRSRRGGFPRVGLHRARFLLESLADLRQSLRSRGSTLLVRCGDTAAMLAQLATETSASGVYTHAEACTEEVLTESNVRSALSAVAGGGVPLHALWGASTMYGLDDLAGLDVRKALPPVFSTFRKHAESRGRLRDPIPVPSVLRVSAYYTLSRTKRRLERTDSIATMAHSLAPVPHANQIQ